MTPDNRSTADVSVAANPARISIALLTIWFAMIAGFGEILIRIGPPGERFGELFQLQPQLIGLVPLAELVLVIPVALVLALINWRRPVRFTTKVFVIGLLPIASLIFNPSIHIIAMIVLTLGVTTVVARLAGRYPEACRRVVYATVAPLAVAAIAAPAYALMRERQLEREGLAQLPAARAGAPNIILIILDTVRALSLSAYGYERPTTPNLERLARQGVRFDWAIAPAPWTLPTHASIMTGRFPTEHRAELGRHLDDRYPTLAEVLRANGYATIASVSNYPYAGRGVGVGRGFLYMDDAPYTLGFAFDRIRFLDEVTKNRAIRRLIGYYEPVGVKRAPAIDNGLLDWLSRNERRPFFAYLNYTDAHAPYLPPSPFDRAFSRNGRKNVPLVMQELYRTGTWTPEQLAEEQALYDGAIQYLDHRLGQLFAELERRGDFENTIVVVTSDHGEAFAEHKKILGHGRALYSPLVHVPLIVAWPGRIPGGVTVKEPTSLRNIPATVTDLAGIKANTAFPGISLARYWDGSKAAPGADLVFSEFRPQLSKQWVRSIVVDGHQYIRNAKGREEFFHLVADPWEQRDLIAAPEAQPALARARASFQAALAALEKERDAAPDERSPAKAEQ